jgi:hypothetical protein
MVVLVPKMFQLLHNDQLNYNQLFHSPRMVLIENIHPLENTLYLLFHYDFDLTGYSLADQHHQELFDHLFFLVDDLRVQFVVMIFLNLSLVLLRPCLR